MNRSALERPAMGSKKFTEDTGDEIRTSWDRGENGVVHS